MNAKAAAKPVRYEAQDILGLESCRSATAVERMAHRWYLTDGDGRPEHLLAPRFAVVPTLRIECPSRDSAWEVHVTGLCPYGWFSHLRVGYPGAAYPITVTHPTFCGRPGYEQKMLDAKRKPLWSAYALTVPPGTEYIEISKTEEVEARLVAVEFRPCAGAAEPLRRAKPHGEPVVVGIIDSGILIAETLQAYQPQPVIDFYRQMRDMGFTHFLNQIYAGSAAWSEVAKAHRFTPVGHRPYANWNEPAGLARDDVASLQADIDRIRAAGMKMVASFRINNEWMAKWAREMLHTGDGIPDGASEFSVEHPEFWLTHKSGEPNGGGLDFAYPQVREYRRDIIAEWCDKFDRFDGICIDVHRHPCMVGYPEHMVAAFKDKTGIDVRTVEPIDQNTMIPEWLEFRAEHFSEFMRMVRELLRERYGDAMQLSARVGNTFDQALVEGVNLKTWIAEGLVDQLILQHRSPANPVDADSRPIIEAAHAAGIRVVHLFGGNGGVDFASDDLSPVRPRVETWRGWGSDGFGFYEAERIVRDGRWLREMPDIVNHWQE